MQASADQIRKMIKDEEGDVFEEMRTLNQELSFAEANEPLPGIRLISQKRNTLLRGCGISTMTNTPIWQ